MRSISDRVSITRAVGYTIAVVVLIALVSPRCNADPAQKDALYDLHSKLMHEINVAQKSRKISPKEAEALLKKEASITRKKTHLKEKNHEMLTDKDEQALTVEITRLREAVEKLEARKQKA